jgi:hypothetical protein
MEPFWIRMAIVVLGGIVTPLIFVLIISEGRVYKTHFLVGLALSTLSLLVTEKTIGRLGGEGATIASVVMTGLIIAFFERGLVTISVYGRGEEEAAWLGFGFGLLQSLIILFPVKTVYPLIISAGGGALYQLYRRALSSLFQSASAMILSRANMGKLVALVFVQAAGISLILSIHNGLLQNYLGTANLSYGALLSLPILKTFSGKNQ